MSTRKPQGKGSGTRRGAASKAAGKSAAKKAGKSAAKKAAGSARKRPVAVPEPKAEAAPPPAASSPTGAPLAFGSRVSEMPPPAQVRSAEAAALRGMVARQGFRAVMSLEPESAAPPSEGSKRNVVESKAKDGQRLAALRKETSKRPVATVRPDYFGTAEHRASAEQLARMLAGEAVFPKASAAQTHVLLRVASPNPVPGALLEREGLSVASADPAWREPFQARLEDLMARYRPLTDLEIRPGLTLTYGEVVALAGDYYATPEELASELTPAVADAIRGVTPQDEGTFLLNTHRGWFDYAMLANENQDHFAPRSWARYARHHREALEMAVRKDLDAALVRNAFADHFLTDAFASGHLRVPRNALEGLSGALPTRKMHDEENVHGLWVQSASGFVWRSYGDDHLGTNPVHLTLTAHAVGLSLLRIFKAYRLEGEALYQLIDALGEAQPLELTAGEMVDPRTLPRFLGDVAGLPSIREHLPVPLGTADEPDTANVLANYPPQVGPDGKRRKETPDFDAYFRFE
ncbi:hypothetical protein [Hyalangium rubrum]|uniref:Uncharacterized protein n=1 Tax=Hyalangium rubrum TaxID=3103134 RepID=A0ABU5HGQ4_9BACT|nr:hypothetical protein [Hyalangium sp. s54d21]MDY7232329.1 hypothetical protein [Hyalangium sp. s54d21]